MSGEPSIARTHEQAGEAAMLEPLLTWLNASGKIGSRTRVAFELPWLGRRIDVATISSGGLTSAFELKRGGLQRAIEQAAYNASSFDRSWVVSANEPRERGLIWASDLGVGIIVVNGSIRVAARPTQRNANLVAARRLRAAIRQHGRVI